ncbi:Thiol:disulfide oxidoreductase [Pseudonocardia sp. Ae168_Ps1]|uniref:TlpA family protein disulfide reductase n=1 Tax=unclassified Pseudonocardia TaxID=2619320 RepID=UPI00094ABA77|nr:MULTISPECIES: TlpA disulfide reductase family protein [unclassified Pseudonocardia]OLL74280.1 Thiol:disulfide oxidoreductase [Pseudonocardia sp. Ae150A_Ps1]OLL80261.1 Thiol:disulfide oxidoreductase [Pseudonocardia sp. Ae168_Ps1]OLL85612.1 Thiol:disulfide oxidoreductase [Pseudonocardia sp. Ae263_Ps1]OLL94360.1 Thiol:disulfide oxidoreductase [Pseudonocardia sp. Ae356_Ps1]
MRRVLLPLLAALLLVGGCGVGRDAVGSGPQEFRFVAPGGQTRITYDPPESRSPITDLRGESLLRPGTEVGIGDHPGMVRVINIWGSWCGPCRTEAPELQAVQDTARDDAVVLGIDVRDDRQAAQDFVNDRGLTYDSIFDESGRTLARLDGYPRNVVPSTIVLDRQARVAAVFLVPVGSSDLLPLITKLAAEPAPAATG